MAEIYEELAPPSSGRWNGQIVNGSKILRSRTSVPQRSTSDGHYSSPRMVTPPVPPTHPPPSVPPRNRHCSEGDILKSSSLGSPNDRGGFFPRMKTPTRGLQKSPSVQSVTSNSSSGSDDMTLLDFMVRYAKSLPLRVGIKKGFYGVSDKTAVTTGEMLNLHFTKNTKVVIIEMTDPDQGTVKLSVPLNSSVKFSPLYDPRNNLDQAKRGFKFETIGDMLAQKVMPKVVCAGKAFTGSSAESSVAENEVLVIKNPKSKLTGKQQLKVFSVTTKRKKTLSANCAGGFTTNPTQLSLPLCDLITSMEEALPLKALVVVGRDGVDSVLSDVQGAIVNMIQVSTQKSVIATNYAEDSDDLSEEPEVAEMPFDLDIEVEPMALEDHEIDRLRADTAHMYDSFDPLSVLIYQTMPTSRLYDVQCQLYKTTTGANDFRGVETVRPISITKQAPKPTQLYQPLDITQFDEQVCQDYYVVMTANSKDKKDTPAKISSQSSQSLPDDISDQSEDSGFGQSSAILSLLDQISKRLEAVEVEVSRNKSRVEHQSRRSDSLQAQIRMGGGNGRLRDSECSSLSGSPPSLENRPPAPLPAPHTRDMRSPTPVEEPLGEYHVIETEPYSVNKIYMSNEEFLSTMTNSQVIKLLGAMGMQQYSDKFREEQISGEILAECNEDILKNDLGVSKLHCLRLMKVVTGRHSAKCILAGEDPYPKKKSAPQSFERK